MAFKQINLEVVCWFCRLVEDSLDWYQVGQANHNYLKAGTKSQLDKADRPGLSQV